MVSDKINLGMEPPALRGRARVQLFDAASGDLVRDEAHDNFVSERWLRSVAHFTNWALFVYGGSGTTNVISTYGALGNVPFNGIALTDYDGEPDQAERVIQGKPAGHARRGVSGAGEWQGDYNAVESIHEYGYHKFVYDFATSQANGTFQSIYTGDFRGKSANSPETEVYLRGGALAEGSSNYGDGKFVTDPATGIMYWCTRTLVRTITDWTPIALNGSPSYEVEQELSPNANNHAFAIRGGRLYWMTNAKSPKEIISAPLSDLSNTTVEKTLDDAWAQSYGGGNIFYLDGFTYHPGRDEFVIAATSSQGPGFQYLTLDPTTFADRDVFGTSGVSSGKNIVAWESFNGVTAAPTGTNTACHFYEFNDDGSVTMTSRGDGAIISLSEKDTVIALIGSYNRDGGILPAQFFFSRALLDEPVTKTVQNVMKITYEFTFDPPSLS